MRAKGGGKNEANGIASTYQYAHCPACERFVGPEGRCPFCETPLPLCTSRRLLAVGAITLVAVGLPLLLCVVRATHPQPIPDGPLPPTANFARVSLTGQLTGPPRCGRSNTWARFTCMRSGQDYDVRLQGDAARAHAGALLAAGPEQTVRIVGDLRLKAGRDPQLFVHRADHVAIVQANVRP